MYNVPTIATADMNPLRSIRNDTTSPATWQFMSVLYHRPSMLFSYQSRVFPAVKAEKHSHKGQWPIYIRLVVYRLGPVVRTLRQSTIAPAFADVRRTRKDDSTEENNLGRRSRNVYPLALSCRNVQQEADSSKYGDCDKA